MAAGPQNQFRLIWDSAGGSFAGLSAQFDDTQSGSYWSGTEFSAGFRAWLFFPDFGDQFGDVQDVELFAVAVHPGNVAAAAPEPQTHALMLTGVGALMLALRRRPR